MCLLLPSALPRYRRYIAHGAACNRRWLWARKAVYKAFTPRCLPAWHLCLLYPSTDPAPFGLQRRAGAKSGEKASRFSPKSDLKEVIGPYHHRRIAGKRSCLAFKRDDCFETPKSVVGFGVGNKASLVPGCASSPNARSWLCSTPSFSPSNQGFYWFEGLGDMYSQLLLMPENAIKENTLAFHSLKLAPCCSAAPW